MLASPLLSSPRSATLSSPALRVPLRPFPLPLTPGISRARAYIHECTSLNKLLFIRPVGEMNLRDSYRTRPDMHDGFESLSLLPNGLSPLPLALPSLFSLPLSLPPPPQESLTVDRCFRDAVCRPRNQDKRVTARGTIIIRTAIAMIERRSS